MVGNQVELSGQKPGAPVEFISGARDDGHPLCILALAFPSGADTVRSTEAFGTNVVGNLFPFAAGAVVEGLAFFCAVNSRGAHHTSLAAPAGAGSQAPPPPVGLAGEPPPPPTRPAPRNRPPFLR